MKESPDELAVFVYENPQNVALEEFFNGEERPNLFQDAVGGYEPFSTGGAKGYWFDNVLGLTNYTVVAVSSGGLVYQFADAQRHQSDGVFLQIVRTFSPSKSTQGATLTYTDPTHGYSFDYPATWYVSPPQDAGGDVILYSYDPANVPPEEAGMPVPMDKLKVFFWVAEGVDIPLEQWLDEGRAKASAEQNLPPPTVVSQSPAVLADRQGVEEIIESDGVKHRSYYIALGGARVFVVNTVPADSQVWPQFEPVLASLRFAEP